MPEIKICLNMIVKNESKIIGNLLGFDEIKVKDIMTPRIVVYAAEESDSIDSYYSEHDEIRFSRIPLYDEEIDSITGYFLKDHLLEALIKKRGEEQLSTLKREIIGVPEMLPLPKLFERFLYEREQIALVVDEFGGMQGIVTLEDCVETLLGLEIMDELDNIDDMQEWARKQWEKRARRIGLDIGEL
jgi:CBS domain containing-hemolysin-like protein